MKEAMKHNGKKMKQITIHVTEETLEVMDYLINHRLYPNRSELIRYAIHQLLQEELEILKKKE